MLAFTSDEGRLGAAFYLVDGWWWAVVENQGEEGLIIGGVHSTDLEGGSETTLGFPPGRGILEPGESRVYELKIQKTQGFAAGGADSVDFEDVTLEEATAGS
ncbi:MAG: hypothetical protein R2733_24410 [Acidimicrobiales bacterium]